MAPSCIFSEIDPYCTGSALLCAYSNGLEDIAEMLLEHWKHADMKERNYSQSTLLGIAVLRSDIKFAEK